MVEIIRFQPNACIEWRAYRDGETDGWVAVCDALRRRAVGESWERLCVTIFETQHAFLTDLLVEGELESFLKHHGLQTQAELPALSPVGGAKFDIPTVVTPMPGVL